MIVLVYYTELEEYIMDKWGRHICYLRVECKSDRHSTTFPCKDNKMPIKFDTDTDFMFHGITNSQPGVPEDPMRFTLPDLLSWIRSRKIKSLLGNTI